VGCVTVLFGVTTKNGTHTDGDVHYVIRKLL